MSAAGRVGLLMAALRRLSVRVVMVSTVLVAMALVLVAIGTADLYRSAIERRFDALLSAHLFSLVVATSLTDADRLVGAPQIGDRRYGMPGSGWMWDVEPASAGVDGRLSSPFYESGFKAPLTTDVPFDSAFERRYSAGMANGTPLRVMETEVVLGDGDRVARFRVTGNLQEVSDEVSAFLQRIALFLGAAGLLMIAINAAAILLVLRPLDRARLALGEIRDGKTERLGGSFPPEIEPLADEINALIDNNRRIVERARVQVGDLAHALKTPLAVIVNEAGSLAKAAEPHKSGRLIGEQAQTMRRQVDHYLQRARIAAQRGSVATRTDVVAIATRIVRVFTKLSPSLAIEFTAPDHPVYFAGEVQDCEEMLGNLMENAAKWARGRVIVSIETSASVATDGTTASTISITIEDDGPGIPEAQREEALKRGRRLDETKPGTGLGLSIVAELTREYGGTVRLAQSRLGGLAVSLDLPAAS